MIAPFLDIDRDGRPEKNLQSHEAGPFAIAIMVDAMKGKQEDLAKTYEFFRRINFYSPTPQVSRTKINEIINMMKASGDLPAEFEMDKIFLSGVT